MNIKGIFPDGGVRNVRTLYEKQRCLGVVSGCEVWPEHVIFTGLVVLIVREVQILQIFTLRDIFVNPGATGAGNRLR